ncbi:hypothetical protein [Seonamhaeicola maritimus]|uniref:Right-handed parallel beta-helix repeat-containing protein n=1 Tax=Seonamhaeicola maritimus TaxID=2591822 RepID=A0A5C7GEM1_9FLAO|nr:hypothetical protein [Seonamhaeicola maritimus]TXG35066.1 hypothetical protein FUA22_15005 [Seonamhaeicola maritimus]
MKPVLPTNRKNKSQVLLKTILTSLLLCFVFNSFSQTVHTVDNRPESGAQFLQIHEAIAAANPGDIIYVHPSPTAYQNTTINKSVTIIGPGHNPANYNGLRAHINYLYLGGSVPNTVISGMSMWHCGPNGLSDGSGLHFINNRVSISLSASQGTCNDWIVEGNYFDVSYSAAVINTHATITNNMQIRNNIIEGRITNLNHTNIVTNNLFIQADPSGDAQVFNGISSITSPIVTNNMFVFTDPDITGLTNSGSTPVTYTNCLTWKISGADLTPLSGTGNLDNTDPSFSNIPTDLYDFYNNDYTLQGGSSAIGAATDGGDIGIFGRGFPFDTTGRPHSMPHPTEMTITNTVVQPGQDLNVTFKATQKN